MAKNKGADPQLDMTPMIDCVFQLLIFFIVSLKPEDITAHLDINRPSPDEKAAPTQVLENLLQIMIFPDGYALNDTPVSLNTMQAILAKQAAKSKTQTVLIKCSSESPHERLIQVLDVCSQVGLGNLSVMSM